MVGGSNQAPPLSPLLLSATKGETDEERCGKRLRKVSVRSNGRDEREGRKERERRLCVCAHQGGWVRRVSRAGFTLHCSTSLLNVPRPTLLVWLCCLRVVARMRLLFSSPLLASCPLHSYLLFTPLSSPPCLTRMPQPSISPTKLAC